MNDISINTNLAFVLRGDVLEIREIAQEVNRLLSNHHDVKLVHKQISVNRLWIMIGDDMNEKKPNNY